MRCKCRVTGQQVAIKLIEGLSKHEYEMVKVIREVGIMRQMQSTARGGYCSFFPQLVDVVVPVASQLDYLFVVMEYEQTDLRKLIRLGRESMITDEHVKLIMYNLLCAFKYMHSAYVIHRDIKPSNLLINKDCQIKVCDLGLARTLPESCVGSGSGNTRRIRESITKNNILEKHSTEEVRQMISNKLKARQETLGKRKRSISAHVTSRWYRAPEISLLEKQYDSASDIWSLGCCMYELMRVSCENKREQDEEPFDRILFPSECCYPLSPKQGTDDRGKPLAMTEDDLLRVIVEKLHHFDEHDLSFLSTSDAKVYMNKLKRRATLRSQYLEDVRECHKDLKQLLSNMLQLNPYLRWSANECLKSPYFDDIRKPYLERPAPEKIRLLVD
jgi:mitogen-activated protein kinase 1/3